MIHKDKGLVVYVDCQPSEQLDYNGDIIACFACLVCLNPEVFSGYKQYKDTPATDRPSVAEELANMILSREGIYCIGCEGKYSAIESTGDKYLSHIIPYVNEDFVKKYYKGYKVRGRKLNSKISTFVPWYSLSLLLMGISVAPIANELKLNNITFSLDHLPGDTKATMEFTKIIGQYPTNYKCWKKTEEKFGVRFEFGNMSSYTNHEGVSQVASLHPGMVLVDWVVHSIYCARNKLANIDGGIRAESYRESMKKPYEALIETKNIQLYPFYGIEFADEQDEIDRIVKENNQIKVFDNF